MWHVHMSCQKSGKSLYNLNDDGGNWQLTRGNLILFLFFAIFSFIICFSYRLKWYVNYSYLPKETTPPLLDRVHNSNDSSLQFLTLHSHPINIKKKLLFLKLFLINYNPLLWGLLEKYLTGNFSLALGHRKLSSALYPHVVCHYVSYISHKSLFLLCWKSK